MNYQSPFQANGLVPFGELFRNYTGGYSVEVQGFEPAFKAMARIQLEMMGFVSRRAQAYLEVPAKLAQCRTPQDVFAAQVQFWQTAITQTAESSQRIGSAWSQLLPVPANWAGQGRGPEKKRDYITFSEPGSVEPKSNRPGVSPSSRKAA